MLVFRILHGAQSHRDILPDQLLPVTRLPTDDQGYFEGFITETVAPPVQTTDRSNRTERKEIREPLFLAILLDPTMFPVVAKRVGLTCQAHGLTQRPIEPRRLHISLLGFGNYTKRLADDIGEVAALIRFAPIKITLDEAMSFFIRGRRKHPFVLTSARGLDDVRTFFQTLGALFCGPKFNPTFNPHMTLVWDPKVIPKYTLTKPLSWTAHEFVLVRSYYGKSSHEIVGRWPFSCAE